MAKQSNEPARSRKRAEQTQQQAADLVGISVRTWQDWELGRAAIPAPILMLYRHLAGIERIPFRAATNGRAR